MVATTAFSWHWTPATGQCYTNTILAQHILQAGTPRGTFEIGHIDQPPFAFWIAFVSL